MFWSYCQVVSLFYWLYQGGAGDVSLDGFSDPAGVYNNASGEGFTASGEGITASVEGFATSGEGFYYY